MNEKCNRYLLITGGVCAILWPISSELLFYALYPVLAGEASIPPGSGLETAIRGMAELGQNQAIIALEWSKVAASLLVLPFLLALYHFLNRERLSGLVLVGTALGLVSMVFTMLTHTVHPTLSHTLGQAYVEAVSEVEQAALMGAIKGWFSWIRGVNQTASLLYQGCVGLVSLGLIRSRTWRGWGWVGLIGALLALVAKLTPGVPGMTNLAWTGLAYFVWPVALGVGLLRVKD